MPLLSETELQSALTELPGWRTEGGALVREAEFPSYAEGLAFVQSLGQEADRRDHHPDLELTYRRVRIALSSHDAGGITERDAGLARFTEGLLAASADRN